MWCESFFLRRWYQQTRPIYGLLPIAWIYQAVAEGRRLWLTRFRQWQAPVPVIVVGNLTMGGVGKTPLVAEIAQHFQRKGFKVGIVSRGYGAKRSKPSEPHDIMGHEAAAQVGDEALWLAETTGCPVVIASNRVAAARHLLKQHAVDLIVSDDGLQHYALGRTVEVAVIDALRGMGNGAVFPAGPLREPVSRLGTVDLCVANGGAWGAAYHMQVQADALTELTSGKRVSCEALQHQSISIVAGIGHPERFFKVLNAVGLEGVRHVFSDHHPFSVAQLQHVTTPLVMTEKDAMKCRAFAQPDWYSLSVRVVVEEAFWQQLETLLHQGGL